jgi:hypothetical protein
MDILLRFLTTIDNIENKKRVLEWLKKIKIIENIIELLGNDHSTEVHSNAAQILCDIIRISREQIVKVSSNENDLFYTPDSSESSCESANENNIDSSSNDSDANVVIKSTPYETNPLLSAIEEYV